MALVRCDKHFEVRRLRRFGYVEYIPSQNLPDIVICGIHDCPNKGSILLKQGERGVLDFKTHTISLDISQYHGLIKKI